MSMNKQLKQIKDQLANMAEKEATQLFRLAWRAHAHECKKETVDRIREEACWLHGTGVTYPERLLDYNFEHNFEYAFKTGGPYMGEKDIRICRCCGKKVGRSDMLFTKDCRGITYRLVCSDCYTKLMAKGYDGEYYDESDECLDEEY